MTEPTEASVEVELQAMWPVDIAAQAVVVNQSVFAWDQENRDLLYMMFGHIAPPLWLSPQAAQQYLAQADGQIAVQPRGSFVLSRTRAEEIWTLLGRHLGKLPNEQG